MLKILENLIIGDTEWKTSPFKFNVNTLNFVGGGETPSYEDVVVSGTNSLTLLNAKANGLSYLKLFGDCTQASTPTPTNPVNIVCNNGTIKVRDKELPSGYKRVKDIIYNNNSYFETAYTMSGSDTMKVSFTKTTSGACNLVGAYDGATPVDTNFSIYLSNLTNGKFLRYNGSLFNSYAVQDTRYDVTMTPTGTQGMEVDSTWEEKEFTSTNTFCIGTTAVSATSAKFIGILHGNVEIVNRAKFIPCERESDSELGYYDTTAETFLENQGTGTLTTSGYDFDNLEIYVDGTAETVQMTYPDSTTSEAVTAQNLLGLGEYQDIQEVLTGHITRKVGIAILTGAEDWTITSTSNTYRAPLPNNPDYLPPDGEVACMCTHYTGAKPKLTISSMLNNRIKCGYKNAGYTPTGYIYLKDNSFESVSDVKDYLTQQYVNGTPVIIVYPLDVTTTETVTAHHLQVKEGDNVVTITQASINSLDMEAKYKKYITPEAEDIGELIISPVPLSNENYLELDGDLLTLTDAPELIATMADIDPTADCFTDETTWQNEVTTYGSCGQYVYDSENNTVRLPKYGNKIYTSGTSMDVYYYVRAK